MGKGTVTEYGLRAPDGRLLYSSRIHAKVREFYRVFRRGYRRRCTMVFRNPIDKTWYPISQLQEPVE